MTTARSIKRHVSLVQFSRDHHYGLLLVWKIRMGLKQRTGEERISDYLLFFFSNYLLTHFREEEERIFPLLQADDELRLRAEQEHREIYSLVTAIERGEGATLLLPRFADLLEAHIRFEERELFNHLESVVDPDALSHAAGHAQYAEPEKLTEWKDEFWKEKLLN